jgi:hypothetical protein
MVQAIAVVAFLGGTAGAFQEAGRRESKRRKETFFLRVQRNPFSLAAREIKGDCRRARDDAAPDCWVFRGNVTMGASQGEDWSLT